MNKYELKYMYEQEATKVENLIDINGKNAHHIAETIFKAFGRAMRQALEHDERIAGVIPSTKGSL